MDESRVDTELPSQMAHLGIMEVDEHSSSVTRDNSEPSGLTPRVLRKRKSLAPETKSNNRRVSMKPRKHASMATMSSSPKQIEALYLNKTVKTVSQTLETIYEEPKTDSDNTATLIGGRKVKRLITFQIQYTKEKIKKRRAKIKKMLGNKSFLNRKKIPMDVFLKTIEGLDLDDVTQTEITLAQ